MTNSEIESIVEEDEPDSESSDVVFDQLEDSLEIEEVQDSQDKSIFVSRKLPTLGLPVKLIGLRQLSAYFC